MSGQTVYLSNYSGTNEAGNNFKHGWRAFATRTEAEADQAEMNPSWADGVTEVGIGTADGQAMPGEEWEGA